MDPVKDTDGNQCVVKGADGHGWVFSIGGFNIVAYPSAVSKHFEPKTCVVVRKIFEPKTYGILLCPEFITIVTYFSLN